MKFFLFGPFFTISTLFSQFSANFVTIFCPFFSQYSALILSRISALFHNFLSRICANLSLIFTPDYHPNHPFHPWVMDGWIRVDELAGGGWIGWGGWRRVMDAGDAPPAPNPIHFHP